MTMLPISLQTGRPSSTGRNALEAEFTLSLCTEANQDFWLLTEDGRSSLLTGSGLRTGLARRPRTTSGTSWRPDKVGSSSLLRTVDRQYQFSRILLQPDIRSGRQTGATFCSWGIVIRTSTTKARSTGGSLQSTTAK